jgi:hypothetical protein
VTRIAYSPILNLAHVERNLAGVSDGFIKVFGFFPDHESSFSYPCPIRKLVKLPRPSLYTMSAVSLPLY